MKQDSVMEQPISKQQDSGKTASEKLLVPEWHQGPKKLSNRENLRRRYKKLFGFKPCGLSEKELERIVLATEADRQYQKTENLMDPQSRATIGDALSMKR
jgi:hypothetical protein